MTCRSDWVDAGLSVTDRQFIESGWRQAWLYDHPDPITEREESAA